MWLELSTTNNDPRVILLHYLTAVFMCEDLCHCSYYLYSSDKGTENSVLAMSHMALRHNHRIPSRAARVTDMVLQPLIQ